MSKEVWTVILQSEGDYGQAGEHMPLSQENHIPKKYSAIYAEHFCLQNSGTNWITQIKTTDHIDIPQRTKESLL